MNFMQNHTLFARRQITKLGSNGKNKSDNMWTEITLKLNKIGPAVKTESQWIVIPIRIRIF